MSACVLSFDERTRVVWESSWESMLDGSHSHTACCLMLLVADDCGLHTAVHTIITEQEKRTTFTLCGSSSTVL